MSTRHDWTTDDVESLYYLPLTELLFQAQTVHRQHSVPIHSAIIDRQFGNLRQILAARMPRRPRPAVFEIRDRDYPHPYSPPLKRNVDEALTKTDRVKKVVVFKRTGTDVGWTVPAGGRMLLGVPWIGLVDWFFVGTDFQLPFLVVTAPALSRKPVRFLSLLLFPLHMASHLWIEPIPGTPVPGFHVVHWLLLGLVLWLALRSPVEDAAFTERPGLSLAAVALAIVLLDAATGPGARNR